VVDAYKRTESTPSKSQEIEMAQPESEACVAWDNDSFPYNDFEK
jgi:hypothetical protein